MIAVLDNHHGSVFFTATDDNSTEVRFSLTGFTPGATHAIHIHEFGDLSGGCKSLGGHYNPTGNVHGHHIGDMIFNFRANKNGEFHHKYIDERLPLDDIVGRSVVIHSGEDDKGYQERGGVSYRDMSDERLGYECEIAGYDAKIRRLRIKKLMEGSLLTGNAGSRIACGVIGRRKI